MKKYYVYILLCSDHKFYVGITGNLEQRLAQHHSGFDSQCFTYRRRPLQLIYLSDFREVSQAIDWEKKIKRWSRKKKEALIKQDWDTIQNSSTCKNFTRSYAHLQLRYIRYKSRFHINSVMVRQSSP